MHDEIEPRPLLGERSENAVEARLIGDVAVHHDLAAETLGKRAHALGERVTLEGESDLGALGMDRLGDAPSDRAIVGDAHDEAPLAGHERLYVHPYISPRTAPVRGAKAGHPTRRRRGAANAPAAAPRRHAGITPPR